VLSDDRPDEAKLDQLINRALRADRTIDQLFWIDATGALLTQQPRDRQQAIFRRIALCIHTTFMLRPHERAAIERRLARIVWPVS
jgi:hypothetical protein